jgi:hypothetical protein
MMFCIGWDRTIDLGDAYQPQSPKGDEGVT